MAAGVAATPRAATYGTQLPLLRRQPTTIKAAVKAAGIPKIYNATNC